MMMKWLKELLSVAETPHMARIPLPTDRTVIPVELEVGDTDQVVLMANRPISQMEAKDIQEAWTAGMRSGKAIILDGFTIHVLRNIRKPAGETP